MGFRDWFSRRNNSKNDRHSQEHGNSALPPSTGIYPWERHPSIYEHLRLHITLDQKGLTSGGETLPDEQPADPNAVNWAPGALDGVMSHHFKPSESQSEETNLLKLIQQYCHSPTAARKLQVYEAIRSNEILSGIDDLLEKLGNVKGQDQRRLYELARSFATESPERGPVKIGIAILGRFRQKQDIPIFRVLGRHDEFTLFCTVALSNADTDSPQRELWELAQQVDGWGRIHIVERLADTSDPHIKAWMLRDGYRNSIMNEYLAFTCATAGGLLAELRAEALPDDALLHGAGELIDALIAGGPAQDINDYTDAAAAVHAYLEHLSSRARTLQQYLTVHTIQEFVSDEKADGTNRLSNGWTDEIRQKTQELCARILSQPQWTTTTQRDLASSDEQTYSYASRAAQKLGINIWPVALRRLEEAPLDQHRWWEAMQWCAAEHINKLLELAERAIPLNKIATGSGNQLGLGPEFQAHQCLDYIVQGLDRFPGQGMKFIAAALQSPVTRNRHLAVRVLANWGRDRWPHQAPDALRLALEREPNDQTAASMRRVLRGESIE